jgi:hypothetical protein
MPHAVPLPFDISERRSDDLRVERDNFGRYIVRSGGCIYYLATDGRVTREHDSPPDRFGFRTPHRRAVDSAFAQKVQAAINLVNGDV